MECKEGDKKKGYEYVLPKLLALVCGQLGRAGTHDGVRWRDVDLFGSVAERMD